MNVQRLAWAGIRLEQADTTLFVDAIEDVSGWADHDTAALEARVIALEATTETRAALITHIHGDHFDPVGTSVTSNAAGGKPAWSVDGGAGDRRQQQVSLVTLSWAGYVACLTSGRCPSSRRSGTQLAGRLGS